MLMHGIVQPSQGQRLYKYFFRPCTRVPRTSNAIVVKLHGRRASDAAPPTESVSTLEPLGHLSTVSQSVGKPPQWEGEGGRPKVDST